MYSALSVHWIWMGPNGHAARPATGGVLPYYTMCSAEADRHVKTIVNTYFLEGLEIHPHNFHYRYVPNCWSMLTVATMFDASWAPGDASNRKYDCSTCKIMSECCHLTDVWPAVPVECGSASAVPSWAPGLEAF